MNPSFTLPEAKTSSPLHSFEKYMGLDEQSQTSITVFQNVEFIDNIQLSHYKICPVHVRLI